MENWRDDETNPMGDVEIDDMDVIAGVEYF